MAGLPARAVATPWLRAYLKIESKLQAVAHHKARCTKTFDCLAQCGLRDGLPGWGQFCIDNQLAAALRGDVKKGLFFRGVGALPFGAQIRSVRELMERLLTPPASASGLNLHIGLVTRFDTVHDSGQTRTCPSPPAVRASQAPHPRRHPMAKPMFDPEALISMFETATAKQGAQLRKAVSDATLAALQGRELTLKNIRSGAEGGVRSRQHGRGQEPGRRRRPRGAARQGRGRHGRRAAQGRGSQPRGAAAVGGARCRPAGQAPAEGARRPGQVRGHHVRRRSRRPPPVPRPMAGAWGQVLEKMQAGGTLSGAQAATTAEQMAEQMQAALRSTRAACLRAAQALAESYTAMVSGVLMGMSDALQSAAPARRRRKK